MAETERLTVTLPADIADAVKVAVNRGEYPSTSEAIREALRDWKTKLALQSRERTLLKADIDEGLRDAAEGRVKAFDAGRIIERGKNLSANRSRFA